MKTKKKKKTWTNNNRNQILKILLSVPNDKDKKPCITVFGSTMQINLNVQYAHLETTPNSLLSGGIKVMLKIFPTTAILTLNNWLVNNWLFCHLQFSRNSTYSSHGDYTVCILSCFLSWSWNGWLSGWVLRMDAVRPRLVSKVSLMMSKSPQKNRNQR